MEEINRNELGLEIVGLPNNLCVLMNVYDRNQPNEHKVFQVALIEDVLNAEPDIMVGLVNYVDGQVRPFLSNFWDENGIYHKNPTPYYPYLGVKKKE
ncbi:hypothetical protein [Winogradskyella luteola]|uniref:Uncharacterized protein n=1 Tax=Winogradskyella luteola TaxID=2828330 RepID=A0A9X1FBM9_9FLAO|nr:hypothetical protein [Winogradskyella luteola]MBV7270148.1 hypothetical protein [Winogradskyella luteola]